jgi:hypothetical protein
MLHISDSNTTYGLYLRGSNIPISRYRYRRIKRETRNILVRTKIWQHSRYNSTVLARLHKEVPWVIGIMVLKAVYRCIPLQSSLTYVNKFTVLVTKKDYRTVITTSSCGKYISSRETWRSWPMGLPCMTLIQT